VSGKFGIKVRCVRQKNPHTIPNMGLVYRKEKLKNLVSGKIEMPLFY